MKNTDHTDFEKWLHERTQSLPGPEVSPEFLAAQRRSIYRRLDEPGRHWHSMRWALSLAMLLLMVAGELTLERRHKTAPGAPAAISDDQLFSDLSAMEQANEPKAIQPMHGLFQE
jgi:hypothetical protein